MRWRISAAASLIALAACGPSSEPPNGQPAAAGWYEFQGSWTATGNRRVLPFGDDRRASIVDFTGSLLLAGPSRPGVGFRAEAITLNDSATGMVGRAVWTDERGDRIFSELRGEVTATRNRIEGTFAGGTGRYAGATGTYEMSWQYVLEAEDGTVQGRAIGLKGRVHVAPPGRTPAAAESKP